MIEGENKIFQAFLGTLLTWALTAVGASMVYFVACGCCTAKQKILDVCLGFASGVMIAASFWSLMSPAIKLAESVGYYGKNGEYAFGPAAIGFLLGGVFVLLSDLCIPYFAKDPAIELAMIIKPIENGTNPIENETQLNENGNANKGIGNVNTASDVSVEVVPRTDSEEEMSDLKLQSEKFKSWKRILLLLIAITVHNIPEGMAVGIGFGAIGSNVKSTYQSARNLALGIGIQNFPEGMAVSIPLCSAGYTPTRAFIYGQLSGVVEPLFGVLGSLIMVVAQPLLPYALAFGAGSMIYVVVDNIIPEMQRHGNGRIASWGVMLGFIVMMVLDVGLAHI